MSELPERPRRVLLLGPVAGRDHLSGDTSYTAALLAEPPPGVEYVAYPDALADGRLTIRGRRAKHGRRTLTDRWLLPVRTLESIARRSGMMYREPSWFVSTEPGAFDLIHAHLFAVRQMGPVQLPIVSSYGNPLSLLYAVRERWSPRHLALADALERSWDRVLRIHDPDQHCLASGVQTVYTEHYRQHQISRGMTAERVLVAGTALAGGASPVRRDCDAGDDAPVRIGFVGRDFLRKGGPVAVAAFAELARRHPEWEFVVVTDPDRTIALDRLERHGELAHDRLLDDVLPRLDVLVLPTELDCGVPLTLLEALQRGVSLVVSTCPWLDPRLDGAAVRRADQPHAVVTAVEDLVTAGDRPSRRRAARNLHAEQFAIDSLHRDLLAAYDRADGSDVPLGTKRRVLVAGRAKELSGAPFDGFALRQRALLELLCRHHEVHLLILDRDGEPHVELDPLGVASCQRIAVPRLPDSRLDRLLATRAALREPPLADWERRLDAHAERIDPEVVVTLGPWLGREFRSLHRAGPAIHFLEEDLQQMAELAPQSPQARLLRTVTGAALARRRWQPRLTVAIGPAEQANAARFARRGRAEVLPLTLDVAEWPLADDASPGEGVVVVGVLREARNAEGLAAVLEEVERRSLTERVRIRLVTGAGIHPMLERFVALDWVDTGPERGTVYDEYRRAAVALIPSFRSTGVKTTILQAWSAGCPVVCSPASATGVAVADGDGLLVGDDVPAIVDRLVALLDDPPLRAAVARRGSELVASRFDRRQIDRRTLGLLEQLALRPGRR